MGWFTTHAGGENNEFDINTDYIKYVEYEEGTNAVGGRREDAVLHMTDNKVFRIGRARWQQVRGQLPGAMA